jgi:hypothetical protein
MIVKQTGFLCTDNTLHATREGAQKHEVELLAETNVWQGQIDSAHPIAPAVGEFVIMNRDALLTILHTRKPRTPKAAKPTRKKATKPVVESEVAA